MTTIRRRLTLWYTVALGVTILAFGTAALSRAPPVEPARAGPAPRARGRPRQPLAQRVLQRAGADRDDGRASVPPLDPGISAYLEAVRDYLVVTDTLGNVLALSEAARTLTADDLERLTAPLDTLRLPKHAGTMRLDGLPGRGALPGRAGRGGGPGGRRAPRRHVDRAGGVRARGAAPLHAAHRARDPGRARRSLGYWLAGTVLRPVQGIMDEVEAISDGRSLHRRLAVPLSGDEMARLALTVNGMLARLEQSFASLHRFTADASHELKTPLMVLRAGVERALVHPGVPAEILQSLDETLAQINEMTELVESLLTLARADEGRAPLAVEESDLRDLLGDVAETAGMLGEGAGITRDEHHAGAPGPAGGGPAPDPGDAAQPGHQRDQVHAAGRHGGSQPRGSRTARSRSPCAIPASASRPAICRTSSTASGGPTRPARAPASGPAPASASRSPSGSRRRTADRSRCRAGRGGARCSSCGCPGVERRGRLP